MDLSLTETQQLIKESAADCVANDLNKDVLLNLDKLGTPMTDAVWRKMAELGWAGMLIPEEYGGTGNNLTDVAVLFEELGRGPVPGPLFSSGVLGALAVLKGGNDSQKKDWLPGVADGSRILAAAVTEADYGWTPDRVQLSATKDGSDYVLNGTKVFVHDAGSATHLLTMARTEVGLSLFSVDAKADGVAVRPLDGFMSGVTEVKYTNVKVPGSDLLGVDGAGWDLFWQAAMPSLPILCAYKVGGCNAVFDLSVAYSRERQQFGQPIGKFQRVQDHIIHIVNYMDSARWTANEALWKLDTGQDAATSVHMAKSVASESYVRACDFGHEVHAGIGVIREYGLTLHTKMSRSVYNNLGAPKYHKKQMETTLGLFAG